MRAVDRDLAALRRASACAAMAPQGHERAGVHRPQSEAAKDIEARAGPREVGACAGVDQGKARVVTVAALVDPVARDVNSARVNARVRVVAIGRAVEAIMIAVQRDDVCAVAVLVDAVVGYLYRARVDGRVVVVAVDAGRRAVAVWSNSNTRRMPGQGPQIRTRRISVGTRAPRCHSGRAKV